MRVTDILIYSSLKSGISGKENIFTFIIYSLDTFNTGLSGHIQSWNCFLSFILTFFPERYQPIFTPVFHPWRASIRVNEKVITELYNCSWSTDVTLVSFTFFLGQPLFPDNNKPLKYCVAGKSHKRVYRYAIFNFPYRPSPTSPHLIVRRPLAAKHLLPWPSPLTATIALYLLVM